MMRAFTIRLAVRLMIAAALLLGQRAHAQQAPAPPTNVVAADHPMDNGEQIDVRWELSADDPWPHVKALLDRAGAQEVKQLSKIEQEQVRQILLSFGGYKVYRSMSAQEIEKSDKDAAEAAAKAAKKAITDERLEESNASTIHQLSAEQKQELRAARKRAGEEAIATTRAQLATLGQPRWALAGATSAGKKQVTIDRLSHDASYLFKVEALSGNDIASEPAVTTAAVSPTLQWFAGGLTGSGGRFWLAIIMLVLCGAVVFWINYARQGRPVRVRKIAGLEAVDEAVGRATEMGRSILFVPGIQDMNDIQTIAGITVLSRVAKTAAEYDAKIEVPTSRSLVMTAARETVQASFLSAGRPDAYNQDLIYYVTDEQFGYVAYLSGMMVREKPAACFYMGHFFAESLILAETGNSIGAIQVAGTAAPAQLPFFVAACDYTLIGEEFFAASAYLSGEPEQLGSLKGQDVGKLIVAAFMLIGIFMFTLGAVILRTAPDSAIGKQLLSVVEYIRTVMLT